MLWKKILFTAFTLLFTTSAFADENVDLATMFATSSNSWISISHFIVGLSVLLGVCSASYALFILKARSEPGQAINIPLKKPIIWIFVGAALINFGLTSSTITESLSLDESQGMSLLTENHADSGDESVEKAINGVLYFAKMIGHIAFVSGFLMLRKVGENGPNNDDTFRKALTHIIGGAMAINIETTVSILAATFGISTPW
ncbi:hypothetical protein [Enterobacter hormaechei]|uniref:hypothetical protein n=1 Tax=Enterobacter hormaechei TaxID=158836 RepID=UPI0023AFFABE|nr:hypothetical protein [Enterobacter hormaechei]MDE7845101.1 hypothetical protein [Enterobacter hormaechei]